MVTESVSERAPPEPVLPRSLVVISKPAVPLKLADDVNDRPLSAALILAIVPVKVIAASAVPSPTEKVNPPIPARLKVPLVPVRVTCTWFAPASTSVIEIRLPLPLENTSATSSFAPCAPGTVFTGASLIAVMAVLNVTTAVL